MKSNIKCANWIKSKDENVKCPVFRKDFCCVKVKSAMLCISAKGVYKAELNGERIGDFVFAPGWTKFTVRQQYQKYDITDMLKEKNELYVSVGDGWHRGKIGTRVYKYNYTPPAIIAEIVLEYADGTTETIITDEQWQCGEGMFVKSDIYDGEVYDAGLKYRNFAEAQILEADKDNLIPQEGEKVTENERIKPIDIITAPNGEIVVDFGQNITGYPEIEVIAKAGDVVDLSFGEVLDKNGNFYNSNYRSAKSEFKYICKDGKQKYKPSFCFYGFRYVRVNSFAGKIDKNCITAIAVYSDIKQIGNIKFGNSKLNKLFSNILWGQKDNFLDIPTDCPQRDERLGWTGDINVFARAACYNFDVECFLKKWLKDLAAEQLENGLVTKTVPNTMGETTSAAWGDAAVNVPWQVYLAYGDKSVLEQSFESMCKWISYITNSTNTEFLWIGGKHYGDWLGLDAKPGSYVGASDCDFIASAFYAYSTEIVIKAGHALNRDVSYYENLYDNIKRKFSEHFSEYKTQTECVLALYFNLCKDKKQAAKQLNDMIKANGERLSTGFVGTPYLLHALSENGYAETAYTLLLQEKNPSWLFSVNMGATTIWEHWDGIDENGDFWSDDMNSYNHYAYGAVADWMYSVAAGIKSDEQYPGYEKAIISPIPDKRIGSISCTLNTRYGEIKSEWHYDGDKVKYLIETPVNAKIIIDGKIYEKEKGIYEF